MVELYSCVLDLGSGGGSGTEYGFPRTFLQATQVVLGGMLKIPDTRVLKLILLHFCKYCNTVIGINR